MIKIIATDLDGTLLDENHRLNKITYEALLKAQAKGIRIIIASGRDYTGVKSALNTFELKCDYVVASGAELLDQNGKLLHFIPMSYDSIEEIVNRVGNLPISIRFCGRGKDYVIAKKQDIPQLLLQDYKLFNSKQTDEEILESPFYKRMLDKIVCVNCVEELKQKETLIHKVFVSAQDDSLIHKVEEMLADITDVVSASSFLNNTEITHIDAQKGPVLKKYIEELGYTMDEVMVFGDSMNDYSMLSMDFGMTVAMENGMEEIKKVAKYITKSNRENGVAYMIEKVMNNEKLISAD